MCLIVLAAGAHPRHSLVVAANRDEFHDRPALPAAWWVGAPHVLAGRDARGGGTWMGITRSGRFAALTNFRDPKAIRPDAPSRGTLVAGFLLGEAPAEAYLAATAREAPRYSPFNLLAGAGASLLLLESRSARISSLPPGVHGVSNGLLDSPWPKVERTKRALSRLLVDEREIDPEALLDLLDDRRGAPDAELPDTGVGQELERALSPPFIVTPGYGTRCSTALLVGTDGRVRLVERSFDPDGRPAGTVSREFWLSRGPGAGS